MEKNKSTVRHETIPDRDGVVEMGEVEVSVDKVGRNMLGKECRGTIWGKGSKYCLEWTEMRGKCEEEEG